MKPITRIRYTEEKGVLTSQPMFAKTMLVTAFIDLKKNKYNIMDDEMREVVAPIEFKTEAQAKKAVKEKLKELGVEFISEVRKVTKEIYPYAEEHHQQDLIDLDMEETDEWLRDE